MLRKKGNCGLVDLKARHSTKTSSLSPNLWSPVLGPLRVIARECREGNTASQVVQEPHEAGSTGLEEEWES